LKRGINVLDWKVLKNINKNKALKRIQYKNKICEACDIKKDYKQHLAVPGHGCEDATIFLIGEAPGKDEMLQGEPFVGRAGKKLDEAIELAGLNREELYIHNILSCRPYQNKFPHKNINAISRCKKWLFLELGLLTPKVVVTVGKTPYEKLLNKNNTKITQERGNVIDWKIDFLDLSIKLIPTLHPSYCMRKINMGDDGPFNYLVKDLKKAKQIAQK
jgi:uracil-DNA glycosylase